MSSQANAVVQRVIESADIGANTASAAAASILLGSYAQSYMLAAGISALAVPFLALSRRQNSPADTVEVADAQAEPAPQPA